MNRPYDIFGTWFSDQHLISGDLHWLAHLVSTSVLWLNKANQEVDSEHVPIMNQLYKFYNRNASSIRGIMIANCPWLEDGDDATEETTISTIEEPMPSTSDDVKRAGNPLSQPKLLQVSNSSAGASNSADSISLQHNRNADNSRSIQYLAEFRNEFEERVMDDWIDSDDESQGLCENSTKSWLISNINFDV